MIKNDKQHGGGHASSGFVIETISGNCVGCNHCTRICPIETANITYLDNSGDIKVKIDQEQCIKCGLCVDICEHGARVANDDLTRFFDDLAGGVPISLITAPSIRTNLPQWKRVFTWLRGLGARFIYDVSLGADICIWAHLRILEKNPGPIITQPCPSIVAYCESHKPELVPFLSPVHSPMACTAIYMRAQNISDNIASISPCLAKTAEHRATGLVQYNITFNKLVEYIKRNNVRLPEEEGDFDHPRGGPGTLFPLPGGLKENLEFFAGDALHVEKAEGRAVYQYLNTYAQSDRALLPDVFDVLNCANGCLIGSGSEKQQNIFAINKQMNQLRARARKNLQHSREILKEYDRRFTPQQFCRAYNAQTPKYAEVTAEELNRAFLLMDKDTQAKRMFNCGACGSNSCHDMARKVARGINVPSNCVIKTSADARHERERNASYLGLIKNIGDNLFSTLDDTYESEVQASLRILSESIHCDAVAIWRRADDSAVYERLNGWYGQVPERVAILRPWPENWINRMKNGENVKKNVARENHGLFPDIVTTVFTVPIHLRGEFWGFVDAISVEEREFSPEEASLLEATGILLISGILERDLNQRLVAAREDAIAGTRAKSDFLSRMSHEMRTPMNAIIGMTHIATTTSDLTRKDYCLSKINDASTHLLGVINDILDMSKIEANKFELAPGEFNFEKMLQKVVSFISFRVDEKKHKLSVYIDSRLPAFIEADEQRLAQVIANLLSNAVKFTPEEGSISIRAMLENHTHDACAIRVEIADTGIGIAPEQQQRLFQSFEQADKNTWRKFGGTGLGLAISKRIIELMDGNIWVESTPGQGSSFIFSIKAKPAQQQSRLMFNIPANRPRPRLLAVEAGECLQELAARFAVDCVTIADVWQDPGQLDKPYDIYFVDWHTANVREVLARIKHKHPRSPLVVMLSDMERGHIEKTARQAGADAFLSRPLFPTAVFNCINQAMGFNDSALQANAPVKAGLEDLHGRRILIAEDVAINREVVKALLRPAQLLIDFAENGKVALQKFISAPQSYEMILMDIQMPEMDGLEATRQIRGLNLPRAGNIPIVAMTANVFREDIENCLACGMNGHVGKPLNYDELVNILQQHMGQQNPAYSERT